MNNTIMKKIEKKFVKGFKTTAILMSLRLNDDLENSIFKPQNIWNAHQKLKIKQLKCLTLTQA